MKKWLKITGIISLTLFIIATILTSIASTIKNPVPWILAYFTYPIAAILFIIFLIGYFIELYKTRDQSNKSSQLKSFPVIYMCIATLFNLTFTIIYLAYPLATSLLTILSLISIISGFAPSSWIAWIVVDIFGITFGMTTATAATIIAFFISIPVSYLIGKLVEKIRNRN